MTILAVILITLLVAVYGVGSIYAMVTLGTTLGEVMKRPR